MNGAAFLLRYVGRLGPLSLAVLGTVISGALCAVAAQYGLKLLVDGMTSAAPNREHVMLCLGLFLALLALESAFWRVGGWLGSRAVIRLGEDIRLDLFERVAERNWAFFNGQASGALAGRITAAAGAGTSVVRTVVWNVLPPATDLIGSVVVLAAIDIRIAAGLVGVAGIGTWALHLLGKRGFPLHQAYHRESAEVAGILADVLANMGLVSAFGARQRERERLVGLMARESRAHARSWLFLERLRAAHDAAFWLATALVLVAAVWEWSSGRITTGGVVVASTLTLRVLMGSRELALSLLGVTQQLGAVSEAVQTLQAPEPVGANLPALQVRGGAIELRSLSYAPHGGRPLFADLDLLIPPGQRVGIVGPSGAGKSTLLRLIQGLELPQGGEVLIDGQNVAAVSPDSLAHAFAVVTQEVPLLHRTVGENLRYGCPDASWDEVLATARATGCDDFIRGLSHGYETVVGERGIRLSGGQRQRLALARALLRRAPALLLDEATSALDSRSEHDVQRAVLALAGRRTILAVAHRLSTLMEFDRVIVLRDGRLVEDGPPSELCRGTGFFAETWRMQRRTALWAGSQTEGEAA